MVDETQDVVETTEEQVVEATPEEEQVEEILDPTPYRNKYRRDLDDKDTDTATEQQDTQEEEKEATPEERPVTAEEKAFKKRYDDLKRHYDKTLSKHKNEVSNLKTQLEQSTNQMLPPTDPNDLAEWRKKYPDVYDVIETIAHTKADEKAKKVETGLKELESQQAVVQRDKAEVQLSKLHPDFNEIREDDKFHEWVKLQDATIQGWLYDNTTNAKLAARAIDLYKMDTGLSKKKVNSKLEASKSVSKFSN